MRTKGVNVKVSKDEEAALISLDWICPHCNMDNYSFTFSRDVDEIIGPFDLDVNCESCGEMVTVVCDDYGDLF